MSQCIVRPCFDPRRFPRLFNATVIGITSHWPNRTLGLAMGQEPFDEIVGHLDQADRSIVARVLGRQWLDVDLLPGEVDPAPIQPPDFRLRSKSRKQSQCDGRKNVIAARGKKTGAFFNRENSRLAAFDARFGFVSISGTWRMYLRLTANLNMTPNKRR